jgi:ATP-dependent helicase/nuclease subunit A
VTTDRQPVDQSARARTLETKESFLVQAPAGSGKTELLTRRLLKLLAEVDEPEQILAITFTLAATAEMRERVVKALQKARETTDTGELQLARRALENDARRGWNLLQQPERLNIRTIDAVCLDIALWPGWEAKNLYPALSPPCCSCAEPACRIARN